MTEEYAGRQVAGMDLHGRYSVPVRLTEDGRKLGPARISNCPAAVQAEMARAERTHGWYLNQHKGWYWAGDTLATAGGEVHLAQPLGVRNPSRTS